MLQTISYAIQFIQILFLLRHQKISVMILSSVGFVAMIVLLALDRRCYMPKWYNYAIAFIIALHYVLLTTLSMYMVVWLLTYWKFGKVIDNAQKYVLLLSLVIAVFGYVNGLFTRVDKYEIHTTKIDQNIRIIHLSDLHISNMFNEVEIPKIVDMVNNLDPDIVCITGDIINNKITLQRDLTDVYSELSKIDSKYGVFVCEGNHDTRIMDALETLCEETGFTLLYDDRVNVNGIDIIGRKCDPAGAELEVLGVNNDNFTVVLDHKPSRVREACDMGADMLLCGHTHGGQLLSIRILFDRDYPIDAGTAVFDNTFVSVNEGAYLIYPYCRVFGKSEIVCLDLVVEQ